MKNLNLRRLGQFLKLDALTNKSAYLRLLLGLLIGHVAVQFGCFGSSASNPGLSIAGYDRALYYVSASFVGMSAFLFVALFSCTADVFKSPQRRAYWLMLPAGNCEKFLARLLMCVVGGMLAHVIVFMLVDTLRLCLLAWLPVPPPSAIPYVASAVGGRFLDWCRLLVTPDVSGLHGSWLALCQMFSALFVASAYLLGAMYFRKASFLKVTGMLVLLFLLAGYVFAKSVIACRALPSAEWVVPVSTLVAAILCTVFSCLSYRKFTHMSVVRRKWF